MAVLRITGGASSWARIVFTGMPVRKGCVMAGSLPVVDRLAVVHSDRALLEPPLVLVQGLLGERDEHVDVVPVSGDAPAMGAHDDEVVAAADERGRVDVTVQTIAELVEEVGDHAAGLRDAVAGLAADEDGEGVHACLPDDDPDGPAGEARAREARALRSAPSGART